MVDEENEETPKEMSTEAPREEPREISPLEMQKATIPEDKLPPYLQGI
jgi:hypothetical protein